jgi:hypothetical protein
MTVTAATPNEWLFEVALARGDDGRTLTCAGPSAAAALVTALQEQWGLDIVLSHESLHPLADGAEGFVAYVELTAGISSPTFAVATGPSALLAVLKAVVRALNRLGEQSPVALETGLAQAS